MDKEALNLLGHYIYSLECTLATYDSECLKKNPAKGFLDRHEGILKKIFIPVAQIIRDAYPIPGVEWTPKPMGSTASCGSCPRVEKLLRYMELGETAEEALARYGLVMRHKCQGADRT